MYKMFGAEYEAHLWRRYAMSTLVGFNEVTTGEPTQVKPPREPEACLVAENEAPKSKLYADLEGEQVGIDLLSAKQQEKLESGIPRWRGQGLPPNRLSLWATKSTSKKKTESEHFERSNLFQFITL